MNYYADIKNTLMNNEITKRVKDYSKNKSDLESYYEVGRLLVEAQGGESRAKYGDGLIKEYSIKLSSELGKGFTSTRLKYMRKLYILFSKSPTLSDLLTWSHYVELLPLDDINVKKINHNKTIGIILVHKNNKFIMKYCSDKKIISKEYIIV